MTGSIKAFVAMIDEFNDAAAALAKRHDELMTNRAGVIRHGRALSLGYRAIVGDLAKVSLSYAPPGQAAEENDECPAESSADPGATLYGDTPEDLTEIPPHLKREG
jgi:hypothetical protein